MSDSDSIIQFDPHSFIRNQGTFQMTGVLNFYDVTIDSSSGTTPIDFYIVNLRGGNVDFGTQTRLSNGLHFLSGASNPVPATIINPPLYQPGSFLQYESGNSYTRGLEWTR